MIPEPPVDGDGILTVFTYDITAALARGGAGICVMCRDVTWDWWDLAATPAVEPVTDRYGALTDQVPLDPGCVVAMVEHWATLLHGDSDDGEPPEPVVRVPAITDAPLTGAYARRAAR